MSKTTRAALGLIAIIAACAFVALAAIGPSATSTHRPGPVAIIATPNPTRCVKAPCPYATSARTLVRPTATTGLIRPPHLR